MSVAAAMKTFERLYKASKIKGMPVPAQVFKDLDAARWALIDLGAGDQMWKRGRELDVERFYKS